MFGRLGHLNDPPTIADDLVTRFSIPPANGTGTDPGALCDASTKTVADEDAHRGWGLLAVRPPLLVHIRDAIGIRINCLLLADHPVSAVACSQKHRGEERRKN